MCPLEPPVLPPQITYSMVVAEQRTNDDPTGNDDQPLSSATMEAMLSQNPKRGPPNGNSSLHPIFRRTSSSSTGKDVSATKTANRGRRRKGVKKEEAIEIVSSDDDAETVVDQTHATENGDRQPSDDVRNDTDEPSGSSP